MARITISAAAKRGFASRPTLYRAIKDGRLTAHQDGDKKTLDLADLVKVFGEPGAKSAPSEKPDLAGAVQVGHLEADRDRLAEEVDRLRQERDQARREAVEEREQARQERDRLLGLVEATQKLLEDQSRERKAKRSWWRLGGKGTVAALLLAVFLISGTAWAFEYAFFGTGTQSCGSWTEAKVADPYKRSIFHEWINGYMTSYSLWVERGAGPVSQGNGPGAWAWMDNYCQENPLKDVPVAAELLIYAIKSK